MDDDILNVSEGKILSTPQKTGVRSVFYELHGGG